MNWVVRTNHPALRRVVRQPRNWNEAVNRYANTPAVNIEENNENFKISLAVPGMKKEDFKISIEKDRLLIGTEQSSSEESEGTNYRRKEFGFRTFKRSFILPESVNTNEIRASYEAGVLSIVLPKVEEAVEVIKEIEVA